MAKGPIKKRTLHKKGPMTTEGADKDISTYKDVRKGLTGIESALNDIKNRALKPLPTQQKSFITSPKGKETGDGRVAVIKGGATGSGLRYVNNMISETSDNPEFGGVGHRKVIVGKKPKTPKLAFIRGESAVNAKGQKVLGPKREAELRKAMKNYERRTKAKIKKYYGEVTPETIEKYRRMMKDRTVIVSFDREQIKNVKAYNTLIKFLNRDKTKEFKTALTKDRREWLTKTLEVAYDLSPEENPELFATINHMSADQILAWATQNPQFVAKLFYHYEEQWDSETHNDWVEIVNELIDTLQPYTKSVIPKVA